jgi:hypothetical protein
VVFPLAIIIVVVASGWLPKAYNSIQKIMGDPLFKFLCQTQYIMVQEKIIRSLASSQAL